VSLKRAASGRLAVAVTVLLALAACTNTPGPAPTDDDVCDPFLLTGSLNGDLTATATPLDAPAFPLDAVIDSVPPDCTAHFAVFAPDGTKVDLDVALLNDPIADLSAQLDDITSAEGWTRDPDNTIWRAPGDGGSLLVLEIEEGSLVCHARSGEVPQAWLPHG
jgi:hypothetical protein